jgi:hypothetical protein
MNVSACSTAALVSGCRVAFDVHQSVRKGDLELDLLTAERGRARQGRDLTQRLTKLRDPFDQGRAPQRPLSRFAPKASSFLDQTSFRAMASQKFWLDFGNISKLTFKCRSDASVKRTSGFAQQGAVGGILYQCVLEQISCVRLRTLPEEQTCRYETPKRRLEFRLLLARHRSQ